MTDLPKHRFIRRPEVELRTGLSRSSIYAKMDEGSFPKQIKLGERMVAWLESDIETWLEERINASVALTD